MSYGFMVKASDVVFIKLLNKFNIPRTPAIFRGCETEDEVAKHFVETIVEVSRKVENVLKINLQIIMTGKKK